MPAQVLEFGGGGELGLAGVRVALEADAEHLLQLAGLPARVVRARFPFLHAVDVHADTVGQFLLFPAERLPAPADGSADPLVARPGVCAAHDLDSRC